MKPSYGHGPMKKRKGNPKVDVPKVGDSRKYSEEDLRRGYRKATPGVGIVPGNPGGPYQSNPGYGISGGY